MICWLLTGSGKESLAVCGARGSGHVERADQRLDRAKLSPGIGELHLEGVRIARHACPAGCRSASCSANIRATAIYHSSSADRLFIFSALAGPWLRES